MRTIASLIAMATGCYVLLGVVLYFMQEWMVFLARLPGRELEATFANCAAHAFIITLSVNAGWKS